VLPYDGYAEGTSGNTPTAVADTADTAVTVAVAVAIETLLGGAATVAVAVMDGISFLVISLK
jgi:hypothetical protein